MADSASSLNIVVWPYPQIKARVDKAAAEVKRLPCIFLIDYKLIVNFQFNFVILIFPKTSAWRDTVFFGVADTTKIGKKFSK